MLIVSKHHDYYDTAIGYGVDKTVVYQRKETDLREHPPDAHNYQLIENKHWSVRVTQAAIGFCGKIYPFVKFSLTDKKTLGGETAEIFFYSKEEVEAFMARKNYRKDDSRRYVRPENDVFSPKALDILFNEGYYRKWNEVVSWKSREADFVKYQCPVFLIQGGTVLNPVLKNFQFYKIKDSYTAFQDIYMFISGVLGSPERSMVEIDDVSQRDKKGFDCCSFKSCVRK